MKRLLHTLLFVLGSTTLLPSCDLLEDYGLEPKHELRIYRGASVPLGNGQATAWISVNARQEPVELGLEFTREAVFNLPPTRFGVQEISLPQRAKELTPFDHIQINWSPQGHDMEGPNGPVPFGPHYDPRFFMTSLAERQAIPASTDPNAKFNVLPPPGYMPATYRSGQNSDFTGIGRQWVEGNAFVGMTHALILGTYNGRYTFILPQVLIDEMRSGNRTAKAIAQPQYFQETNTYYPTTYNVYADAQKQTHYLTLGGFVRR